MPLHESDSIETILDSPFVGDPQFDDYFAEEQAIDDYISRCLGDV